MQNELIEEIEQVGSRIDNLTAIRALQQEIDNLASQTVAGWAQGEQPSKITKMLVDQQLQRVMRAVPDEFRNGFLFVLKPDTTATEANKILFQARMAVSMWMLFEWNCLRNQDL